MAFDDEKYSDNYKQEEDDYNEDPNAVEIYAKRPIFWFTVFFYTIFGGIMLAINLRNAGYKKAALSVILFAVGYYLLSSIVVTSLMPFVQSFGLNPQNTILIMGGLTLLTNAIGGLILTEGFYNKYFPEDDYYPRSINTPLIIAACLFLLQFMMASMVKIPGLTGM